MRMEKIVLPVISPTIGAWFIWYVKKYQVGKCFNGVRILKGTVPDKVPLDQPLIIYLNHPSWWDPLLCVVLSEFFPGRTHYAPMEAEMLAKYKIFSKLGFFGVESTPHGAINFLRTSEAILSKPGTMLWLTAQGEFRDVRQRPPLLKNGLGSLLHRINEGIVLPLAIEYPFWNEKKPEAVVAFGTPIDVTKQPIQSTGDWTKHLEAALISTQDKLAEAVVRRDKELFDVVVSGKSGVGGVYDLWRRMMAQLRGKRFSAEHE